MDPARPSLLSSSLSSCWTWILWWPSFVWAHHYSGLFPPGIVACHLLAAACLRVASLGNVLGQAQWAQGRTLGPTGCWRGHSDESDGHPCVSVGLSRKSIKSCFFTCVQYLWWTQEGDRSQDLGLQLSATWVLENQPRSSTRTRSCLLTLGFFCFVFVVVVVFWLLFCFVGG